MSKTNYICITSNVNPIINGSIISIIVFANHSGPFPKFLAKLLYQITNLEKALELIKIVFLNQVISGDFA